MTVHIGLDAFAGEVLAGTGWFGRDFGGLRVAVLAPGRDAAIIVPQVVTSARAVVLFQEEPAWVLPLPVPGPVAIAVARAFLRREVRDPWRRRLLTPDHRFGSRRTVVAPGYYAALRRPNCTLIAWPVYAAAEHGIRSVEGIEHRVDCVVVGPNSKGLIA